jgi:hypothetical protein
VHVSGGPSYPTTRRPPGFWLPWWLVEHDLTWSARLVYARVAFYPRDEDGATWFKQADVARELGMGRRTVQRALDDLAAAGLLVPLERSAEERLANRCQHYFVLAPDGALQGAKLAPSDASERRPDARAATVQGLRIEDQGSVPSAETHGARHAGYLCDLMAASVERRTGRRPPVTKAWLASARLLVDGPNGPSAEAVREVIAWVEQDDFWRANVLSMPKLRERWDQLVLQRQRGRGSGPGLFARNAAQIAKELGL